MTQLLDTYRKRLLWDLCSTRNLDLFTNRLNTNKIKNKINIIYNIL